LNNTGENEGNGGFIHEADCVRISGKINLALFGVDGRGGMEADIKTILQKTSFLEKEVQNGGKMKLEEEKLDVTRFGIKIGFLSGLIGALAALAIAYFTR